MAELEQQLKRIQEKLQLLIKQQAHLEKENQSLKVELGKLNSKTSQSNTVIESLKEQVDILKFSNGNMEPEEKKLFEKRINSYLKEIDRCITMLNE